MPNFTSLSLTRPKRRADGRVCSARGRRGRGARRGRRQVRGGKAIFDPIDHAPLFKNQDANDKEEAFCVKVGTESTTTEGMAVQWYRAEGLAKWIGGQQKGLPPNDQDSTTALQRRHTTAVQSHRKSLPACPSASWKSTDCSRPRRPDGCGAALRLGLQNTRLSTPVRLHVQRRRTSSF